MAGDTEDPMANRSAPGERHLVRKDARARRRSHVADGHDVALAVQVVGLPPLRRRKGHASPAASVRAVRRTGLRLVRIRKTGDAEGVQGDDATRQAACTAPG